MRAQERFCTASAFLTYQAAVFSLPGRQLLVMWHDSLLLQTTSNWRQACVIVWLILCSSLHIWSPLFCFFTSVFFFFLALFAPFCAGWDACIRKNDSRMKVFSLSSVHVICVVVFFSFIFIVGNSVFCLMYLMRPLSHRWVLHVRRPLIKPSH